MAIYFNWFSEPFDRMSRDGRETQWRSLCETEAPENTALPDKLDEVYTPTQKLCVIRAVRPDRFLHASLAYVNCVLGKRYEKIHLSILALLKIIYFKKLPWQL